MGPTLIFDKSLLHSLSVDEAVWLDTFFLSNITPLLFVETLADLEKEAQGGRFPEAVVGNLALKTPDLSSKLNVLHTRLLEAELIGGVEVDMRFGRPIISGGTARELEGRTGVMFEPSPEEEAFERWRRGQFLELEREFARGWRQSLGSINLNQAYETFKGFFDAAKPTTLEEVKRFADSLIEESDPELVFTVGMHQVGVPATARDQILQRWRTAGEPPLRKFAPYFSHVLSVDFFFYLAIAADLIGRDRPSNKVDLAYLYYLPFCMVFTSNDRLHARVVPLFLTERQSFVPGQELKADLVKLDAHYDAFSDEVKSRGISTFAAYPPHDDSFLVTRLWDRYMAAGWRNRPPGYEPRPNDPTATQLTDEVQRFEEGGRKLSRDERIGAGEADFVTIKRRVRMSKGKWRRFPPEVVAECLDSGEE